ncbi:MAG TPA: O-antigen ligase family protein [Gaiellaceae bacterium]|nr:O-antigen ligase family protein [Gaiellaceae bacterium]
MASYGGPAAAAGTFAITAALACDGGGFDQVTWTRMLVVVAGCALAAVFLLGSVQVGRDGAVAVGGLTALTAWTAASWLWSESPPRALVEAQRVALYTAVVFLVAAVRPPVRWVAAGVACACAFVAVWNLVTRVRGVDDPGTTGAQAAPVGYANSLGLVCVVGLVLLPMLPRIGLVLLVPLAVDLALQRSSGAIAALAAGLLAFAFVGYPRARRAVVVLALAGAVASPFALSGHERVRYWHAAIADAGANPVLGSGAGTYANWWLRKRAVPLSTREAHSLYLETVAELGPLGLALLGAALAAQAVAAWRRRLPAVAGVVVAYGVACAVDFHWELAGATAPVLVVGAAAAAGRGYRLPRAVLAPALAVLTAAGALAYAGATKIAAADDALLRGDAPAAVAAARDALRFAPYDPHPWVVIGDATADAAAYRKAIELDPNDWSLWQRLAARETGESRRRALREAARLNPLGASAP